MKTPPFRYSRSWVAFAHDLLMAAVSFPLSMYLRLGELPGAAPPAQIALAVVIFTAICVPVFLYGRLYRGIWRYASTDDLIAILRAVTLALLIFLPVMFSLTRLEFLPRSLPFLNWFVLITLLGGPRFLYRIVKDRRLAPALTGKGHRRVPVLLAGDGDAAEAFIRAQKRDPHAPYLPVGLLARGSGRVGRAIHGVPIIGTLEKAGPADWKLLSPLPEKIILTHTGLEGALVRRLFDLTQSEGLSLARLPGTSELKAGLADEAGNPRPIAVEDLLGRRQAKLDRPAMRGLIAGRRVLITGAGGTIGAELARQCCALGPAAVTLLDGSEYQLYEIDREIGGRSPGLPRRAILADVRDAGAVDRALARARPDLVFHAAALKHVPMVENNPLEGLLTNSIGSRIVADACRRARVRCMVQISTDKAVNPSSLMGATKRLAEDYIRALDLTSRQDGGASFVVVRFGNVLGSTGSVVPLFEKQLAAGGPLTVTHPDVSRYFMTVREAVELVLQASVLGTGDAGATGRVFVLDMGQPVRIADLARQMILLAGKRPGKDVEIRYTGLRPGEKLHEELVHEAEQGIPAATEGLTLTAPHVRPLDELAATLDRLEDRARAGDLAGALAAVRAALPGYRPDAALQRLAEEGTPPS